jgi:hypothetical protein
MTMFACHLTPCQILDSRQIAVLVRRVLGTAAVLVPQTRRSSLFGTPVDSSILEPQLVMHNPEVMEHPVIPHLHCARAYGQG